MIYYLITIPLFMYATAYAAVSLNDDCFIPDDGNLFDRVCIVYDYTEEYDDE